MQPINDDIKTFIQQQKAASICVVNTEGDPYCFSCFYTFNAADGLLYFKTAATSFLPHPTNGSKAYISRHYFAG